MFLMHGCSDTHLSAAQRARPRASCGPMDGTWRRWGVGLVAGGIRHPADGKSVSELYSYVPASFSYFNDKMVLHTNVGTLHNTLNSSTRGTWGIGSETSFAENTWFIAEAFRQKSGRPFFQAGVRHWIVPNHVQIDATYGNRFGTASNERWFSIGLRLLSPAFLP